MKLKEQLIKLRSFYEQSKRVWQITRKPTKREFKVAAIISAIGIGIIGLLGFILYALWQPLLPFFR